MNNSTCCTCGCVLGEDDVFFFDDDYYCGDCLDERTVTCCHCGKRILRDDDFGDDYISLCNRCRNQHYLECNTCGRLIREEDAYYESDDDDTPYCHTCHFQNNTIKSYYYKPEPIFYGDGIRYFGVELEVDGAGENNSHAKKVLEIANQDAELVYCKHDGSLDEGFEIVTHPMSLSFHKEDMPWNSVLAVLRELGYRSHQTSTCGLHCHINRDSLGDTVADQDETIARILFLVEKFWNELVRFSRRTIVQLDQWAARYGYDNDPKEILKRAKGGMGRYCCVNLNNRDTIEFRIFRGTLKYNSIIAALQLVNQLCEAALFCTDTEIQNLSWTAFVSSCSQPELIQYLKERQLYINDPIESEVEV